MGQVDMPWCGLGVVLFELELGIWRGGFLFVYFWGEEVIFHSNLVGQVSLA